MKKLAIILVIILSTIVLAGCENTVNSDHKHEIKCEIDGRGWTTYIINYCEDCNQITEIDILETPSQSYKDICKLKESIAKGEAFYIDNRIEINGEYYYD